MKKIRELLHPFTPLQFLAANLALGFMILVLFMPRALTSLSNFAIYLIWAFLICITQWLSLEYVSHLVDLKIKWIEKPVLRSIVGIVTLVVDSVVVFTLVQLLMMYLVYHLSTIEAWPYIIQPILFALLISFIMSLIFTAIGFFKAWKTALISSEKLKAEMMAYKYESLRNQINPHFLFNSFNVLSDLVYADQAMAVKFINQLSELFRYVLDNRDKELVTLQDELDFMNSFVYLLKTRFENKLRVNIEVTSEPEEFIVPMTLQLLVENAVKHNEVSEAYPLSINIRRNNSSLEVENSLRIKAIGDVSTKTGLKNISQQFSYFTDREVEVHSSDNSFLVRVPILKTAER
jgi:two-component system, LytTR family, sensor kinase